MKSQVRERAAERPFRFAHSPARAAAGVAAAVAVASFAALVFGPLADERALALAGTHDGGRAGRAEPSGLVARAVRAAPSASAAAPLERVARAPRGKFEATLVVAMPQP